MSMFTSGKVAARVESSLFHAGATTINGTNLGTTNPAHWQMRAATLRTFFIPLASKGAIDLGLTLHHTFKAAGAAVSLTANLVAGVSMVPYIASGAAGYIKNGQKLWTGTIPSDGRFHFISERGTSGDSSVAARKVIEIPELRQPVEVFILEMTPLLAPDEGDLFMRAIWRY